jgi:hypothetical protein
MTGQLTYALMKASTEETLYKFRFVCVIVLASLLVGCFPQDSLNPLYDDEKKDIVFDESLLGTWAGPDNDEGGGLEFSTLIDQGLEAYVVTLLDKAKGEDGDKMVFNAFLVKLGNHEFLDMTLQEWDAHTDSFPLQVSAGKDGTEIEPRLLRLGIASYLEFGKGTTGGKIQADLKQAHWIVKLTRNEKHLSLAWMDDNDFKTALQTGSIHLPVTSVKQGGKPFIVITADTKELQRFVLDHANDSLFFSSRTGEMTRAADSKE